MVKLNLCLHSDTKFVLLAIAVITLGLIGCFLMGARTHHRHKIDVHCERLGENMMPVGLWRS